MDMPDYKCHLCKRKHKDKERQTKYQTRKGCFTPKRDPIPFRWSHINRESPAVLFFKCPASFYDGELAGYINNLSDFPKILPFEGSILDQPSKIVDLANLVQNLISEQTLDKQAKQKLNNG